MKDAEGTTWHQIMVSEHDRDALSVARRLVIRALRQEGEDASIWSNGAGAIEPQAVVINLDRMIEDWDVADSE